MPDDVTIAMIRERLSRPDCQAGAILDGFPRTPAQADALKQMLAEFDGDVDYGSVCKRGRRSVGRASFWTLDLPRSWTYFPRKIQPAQKDGICDLDGSELYQRDDDKAETVTRRIQVYLEQTSPLIEYYRECWQAG